MRGDSMFEDCAEEGGFVSFEREPPVKLRKEKECRCDDNQGRGPCYLQTHRVTPVEMELMTDKLNRWGVVALIVIVLGVIGTGLWQHFTRPAT